MSQSIEIQYWHPACSRPVVVRVDIPEAESLVSSFYTAYRVPSAQRNGVQPREITLTRCENGEYSLVGPSGEWFADGAGEAVAFYEAELTDALLLSMGDFIGLHGSSVIAGSECIMLLGPSGAGKSTLSLALCNAGMELLADDALLIDPENGKVRPFERSLRVHEKGLDMLRFDPANLHEAFSLEPYYWFAPRTLRAQDLRPTTPTSLVFLESSDSTSLEPLSPTDTLKRLMIARLNEVRPTRDFQVLTQLSKGVRGYSLKLGDFSEGLKKLKGLAAPARV